MVLGINTADTKKKVVELLENNGVDFPNILDSTTEAQKAMMRFETLGGMSAVPMTYLIDRDGKVLKAWYGYQKEKTEKTIKELGLDGPR